ncbi:hypothetical protein BCR37DRAFT_384295 [Protomyces lactucae-debilis]|uniref:Uncharacterized protein n=1 Tax=Protomyces lactucae-debilis TaxID=2754530 RepID=A0A1Y2ETH1_PROLT|nr:uncharacterized protein BCR37DRAFT_384295 [Protomyces lactucae-debilis]ORY74861.1 hypothetical protein BCR37DRAFT_384295 [Protomyces lactucae-debilis]
MTRNLASALSFFSSRHIPAGTLLYSGPMKRPRQASLESSPSQQASNLAADSPQEQSTAASTPPATTLSPAESSAALIKDRILSTHRILAAYTTLQQRCKALEADLAKHSQTSDLLLKQKLQQERLQNRVQGVRINQLEDEVSKLRQASTIFATNGQGRCSRPQCRTLEETLQDKDTQIALMEGQLKVMRDYQEQISLAQSDSVFDIYNMELGPEFDQEAAACATSGLSLGDMHAADQPVSEVPEAAIDPDLQAEEQDKRKKPRIKALSTF